MALLYKEEWGEHRKGCKEVEACLDPHMNTYQKVYMCPPPLIGHEELGEVWAPGGGVVPVAGKGREKGQIVWLVMLVFPVRCYPRCEAARTSLGFC